MCGRYNFAGDEVDITEIIEALNRKYGPGSIKTGEIRPTNTAAALVQGLEPVPIRWGFPKWDGKGVIINAVSETVHDKRMFGKSILERRCVIPSTGFFEWQEVKETPDQQSLFQSEPTGKVTKVKYLFTPPGQNVLYMAGFYNTFKEKDGIEYRAFVILTTQASPSVEGIHDRMPVILGRDERQAWIEDQGFMQTVLDRPGPVLVHVPA